MSKENITSEMRLIQLNNYIRPKLEENKSKNWVLNGRNNEFYNYIIDRYNGSPTNAAIINSYTDLIYGNGLTSKDKISLDKLNEVLKPKELRKIIADFALFGEASIQTVKKKGKNLLPDIYHIPKNLVAPSIENDEDEIEGYWYSKDWKKQYENVPVFYPSFGTSSDAIEIFNIKPYKAGKIYFADPDYLAGLPYAEMEEEIANLNINSIKQGLSAGYIINVPNGINWSTEQKDDFEKKIQKKLAGSTNASQFVLSFNGMDVEIKIVPFPVNENIHKQWEFLTGEARQQLMTAHRVTSPMLFGIKDATGFGNNADEMDTAESQLMKRVIKPKQEFILNALEEIMEFYGITIDLNFIPLSENPDATNANEIKDTSSIITRTGLSEKKNTLDTILEKYAQDPPEDYELHSVEYDVHNEDIVSLSAIQKSEQDTDLWKIRYAYNVGTSKTPKGESRSFCNKMMSLSDNGKVFRVEDIKQMSDDGVNGEFAHSGGKYDIFLYAGGVNCHHRWERRIYKKKRQEDGKPYVGNALQNTFEVNVNEARRQGAKIPVNPKDVAIAEIDKPNKGAYPS